MTRKDDLENHIRASSRLIKEYEDILRESSNPKEKARCRRDVQEQRELIAGYAEEYLRLVGPDLPEDIAAAINSIAGSAPPPEAAASAET